MSYFTLKFLSQQNQPRSDSLIISENKQDEKATQQKYGQSNKTKQFWNIIQ